MQVPHGQVDHAATPMQHAGNGLHADAVHRCRSEWDSSPDEDALADSAAVRYNDSQMAGFAFPSMLLASLGSPDRGRLKKYQAQHAPAGAPPSSPVAPSGTASDSSAHSSPSLGCGVMAEAAEALSVRLPASLTALRAAQERGVTRNSSRQKQSASSSSSTSSSRQSATPGHDTARPVIERQQEQLLDMEQQLREMSGRLRETGSHLLESQQQAAVAEAQQASLSAQVEVLCGKVKAMEAERLAVMVSVS